MTTASSKPSPFPIAKQTDPKGSGRAGELSAANINPRTGLATDYLNHFNEAIMLLEMIPDMPDCAADFMEWQPLTYPEHFMASNFKARDLAIEAYDFSPPEYKKPFDQLVAEMNRMIALSIERLDIAIRDGNPDVTRLIAERASRNLQDLIGQASAVIHGTDHAVDQAQIDALMEF